MTVVVLLSSACMPSLPSLAHLRVSGETGGASVSPWSPMSPYLGPSAPQPQPSHRPWAVRHRVSMCPPTLWLQEVKNTFPFLLAEARAWGGHGAGVAPCLPGGSQAGLEPSLSLVESPNLAWPFTCKRNEPSGVLSPGSVGLKPAHPPVPGRTKFPLGLQPI